MSDPLDLAGNVELRRESTITALDTAWIAIYVAPDGEAIPITGGWLRAMLRAVDEDSSVPGAPVLACREPEAFAVGEVVSYRIPVVPNPRR